MTQRLVIVQPYVPTYRVRFFKELRQQLASENIDCIVAAGVVSGNQAKRGDSVRADWLLPLKRQDLQIAGRSVSLGLKPPPWLNADGVILGLEGTSVPVYKALISRKRTGVPVGLWGHVRPYVTVGNKIDLWLEKQQMKSSNHVFAYTHGGRDYALEVGVDPLKVTSVMNSIDTGELEASRENITKEDVEDCVTKLSIDPKKTLCFIGGLDASKRVQFLAKTLDQLWAQDPSIHLLLGGQGPQKYLLQKAIQRGQVIDLGYLDTRGKALAMSISRCVVMPGRIGLIAVDALVMRRPIVTTEWPYHAPESDYLSEGETKITAPNNVQEYAEAILGLIEVPRKDPKGALPWLYPGLDEMVNNFSDGVKKMMGRA